MLMKSGSGSAGEVSNGGSKNTGVKRLLLTSLSLQARDFFVNSTLHGVKFITGTDRPLCERLLWFCSTSSGTIAALIIIVSLWEKFQTNPTITGLDTDFQNWEVPFPALTLCQNDPSNRSLIQDYVERHWGEASEQKKTYYENFLVALANISYQSLPDLQPYLMDDSLPQENLKQVVYEIVNRCDTLTDCIWKGEEMEDNECCPFFYPIFTENGFCYTFNLHFNESEWPFETSLTDKFNTLSVGQTDQRWSMSIDNEDAQNNTIQVYLTNIDDMPFFGMNPQHVWDRKITLLLFVSKETFTTDDSRQLSIRQRRCVFPDEKPLFTDTKYTHSACMRQCRMQLAHKLCGCLPPFYQPLARNSKVKFRYCNLRELKCIIRNIESFNPRTIKCPCELGCMNTEYEIEKLQDASPELEDPLQIGFSSLPLVRYKREVLFGWTDLMVSFGGIAGLFLGFSLLSGVELIYYFTLRAWCMVYRDREELERLALEYEQAEVPKVDLSLKPSFLQQNIVDSAKDDGSKVFVSSGMRSEHMSSQRRRKSTNWPVPYLP